MIVRPATAADAEALAVVQVRTWQDAYRGQVPQEHLDQLDPSRRHEPWRRWVEEARPPAATLVAEDEARGVVGFVSVSPSRDADTDPEHVGEVQAIYLLPEHQGRGVGRLLMDAGLSRLAQGGYREVVLWVLETNASARRFYEAGGWRADGASKRNDTRGAPLEEVRYRYRSRSGR
ncbi:GNAT family N-acetyltransferase [Cryptosporangium minutisporangium]|uniref:GNAT family N-acetyltransferase n=1 Tax=Cryptosporangium minutisporangium TaxID=113569 RepID=A0ABP6SYD1_9ACTN